MELIQAKELSLSLLSKHNLPDWEFDTFKSLRCLGRCNSEAKLISLSVQLITHGSEALIKDTILHEIAHALTPGEGHGPKWKMKASQIGATPKTCAETTPEMFAYLSPYRGVCRACGYIAPVHRVNGSYTHKDCPKAWKDHTIDIFKN